MTDPNRAAEEGLELCRRGRAKEAAEALEKLHLKRALTGRARLALAQAYFDIFRLNDAERLVQDDSLDEDAHAQRLRAELALEANRRDDAITFAKRALSLDHGDVRAREILLVLQELPDAPAAAVEKRQASLGRLAAQALVTACVMTVVVLAYAWHVRVGEEVDTLVKAARAARDKMDRSSLERAIALARQALDKRNDRSALGVWAEAEALLAWEHGTPPPVESVQSAVAANAESGERYFAEAATLIMAGASTKAVTLTTRVISDGGVDARVLLALALAEKSLGRLAAAKDALRRAFELNPYHPLVAVELGDAYLLEGDPRNADYYWRKAREASPTFERAAQRLEGDPAKTPQDPASQCLLAYNAPTPEKFAVLAQRFPGVEALVFAWARAAAKAGKVADAEAVLEKTPDVARTPRAQALIAELSVQSDASKAEAMAKGVLAGDPKQPDALYVLGRLAQQKGEQQRALELYTQALQQRATFPEVYQQVGNVFVDAKDYAKGKEQLQVAERMYRQGAAPAPVMARIYEDLARCAEKAGNAQEASEYRSLKSRAK